MLYNTDMTINVYPKLYLLTINFRNKHTLVLGLNLQFNWMLNH